MKFHQHSELHRTERKMKEYIRGKGEESRWKVNRRQLWKHEEKHRNIVFVFVIFFCTHTYNTRCLRILHKGWHVIWDDILTVLYIKSLYQINILTPQNETTEFIFRSIHESVTVKKWFRMPRLGLGKFKFDTDLMYVNVFNVIFLEQLCRSPNQRNSHLARISNISCKI